MNQLSAEALEVLRRLCAAYAALPFEEGREERHRPLTLCRAEQRLAMNELRRAGVLTARHKILGEKLYQIPVEQLPILEQRFFSYSPTWIEGGSVQLIMETGAGLCADLFRALLFIAQEGLPLTAKGVIHKKQLNRLAGELSFGELHLSGLVEAPHSVEKNVLSAITIVDIMLCLGLVHKEGSAYLVDKTRLDQWLQLPEAKMTEILYGIVINRCGSITPPVQHFRYMISGVEFIPERWIPLSDVLDWMESCKLSNEINRAELNQSALNWLHCLTGFGWCELGRTTEDNLCFRWTAAKPTLTLSSSPLPVSVMNHSMIQFIVQPDFEVLVPPEVPYSVRWTLAGCAELLQSDVMWSFRLTRERLELASESVESPETIISWLDNHAQGGLPQVVKWTLEQWGTSIGRTKLSQVILLNCQTEEDGAAIAGHPRLQDHLERVGPLHFIVKPDSVELLRKELYAAGLAPPRIIGGLDAQTTLEWRSYQDVIDCGMNEYSVPEYPSELGLLRSTNPFLKLPVISPDQEEDLFIGGESVPQIWSKEWRHYHTSTAQKVIEQGMKWGVKVRFVLKNQKCDFIPFRIIGNPWRVSGLLLSDDGETVEDVELTPEDWKEMKLIIPK